MLNDVQGSWCNITRSLCVHVELWWAVMVQSSYAMISITLSCPCSVTTYWYMGKVDPAICLIVFSAPFCVCVLTSKAMILPQNVSLSFACHSRWTQTIFKWFYIWISDKEAGSFMLQFSSSPLYHWGCEIVWDTSVCLSGMTVACHLLSASSVVICCWWYLYRASSMLVVFHILCIFFEGLHQTCHHTVQQGIASAWHLNAIYTVPPKSW
jgi:hypothetical protein